MRSLLLVNSRDNGCLCIAVVVLVVFVAVVATVTSERVSINSVQEYSGEDVVDFIPDGDTTGSCADQLSPELHKRNCRYGRCEQIRNGTDFVCHCDNYITGKRCDRSSRDPTDACASNPCWGDSICIVLETDNHFKCLCTSSRRGKYCQIQMQATTTDEAETTAETEAVTTSSQSSSSSSSSSSPSYDYNEQYSYESESIAAAKITQRADDQVTTETSTAPMVETNLKGDIQTYNTAAAAAAALKHLMLNQTRTIPPPPPPSDHVPSSSPIVMKILMRNNHSHAALASSGRLTGMLNETTMTITSMTATKPLSYKQRNVTTRGLYNTYVPTSDLQDICNYNTCQLGKCLLNGTCECVKPAIGKFCDQIDECLVLNCLNGECITGKGCICKQGYYGSTCEYKVFQGGKDMFDDTQDRVNPKQAKLIDLSTITSMDSSSLSSSSSSIGSINSKTTIKTTPPASTSSFTAPLGSRFYDMFDNNEAAAAAAAAAGAGAGAGAGAVATVAAPATVAVIAACENGGLLIDNICICLNHFSGPRCEISPMFSEQDPAVAAAMMSSSSSPSAAFAQFSQTSPDDLNNNNFFQSVGENENMEISMQDANFFFSKSTSSSTSTTIETSSTSTSTSTSASSTTSTSTSTSTTTITTKTTITTTTTTTRQETTTTQTSSSRAKHSSPIASSLENEQTVDSEDEFVPVFTLSRYNIRSKNATTHRSVYWPWFECFPNSSRVYVKQNDGQINEKYMFELDIGDSVLIGENEFSNVVNFLHRVVDIDAEFIRLHFSEHNYITMTPKHLVLLKPGGDYDESEFAYRLAKEAREGDLLKYYNFFDDDQASYVRIRKIETLTLEKSGIFAPLTESGTLVVDNVHVSCFSMVKSHTLASSVFAAFNWLSTRLEAQFVEFATFTELLFGFVEQFGITNVFLHV